MGRFVLGFLTAFVALSVGVFTISRLGLYPIGADNSPSALESTLAGRAMDVYVAKHQPSGDNPVPPTPDNLIEGARNYERKMNVASPDQGSATYRTPAA